MPIPNFIQIYDPVDCFDIMRDDRDPHRIFIKQHFDGLIVGTQTMSKDFRERLKPEFDPQNKKRSIFIIPHQISNYKCIQHSPSPFDDFLPLSSPGETITVRVGHHSNHRLSFEVTEAIQKYGTFH